MRFSLASLALDIPQQRHQYTPRWHHACGYSWAWYICRNGFLRYKIALIAALFDCLVHYHIDWAKMNLNTRFDLKSENSESFWITLGFDQFLHHATYFIIVYYAFVYYN